jgi:spermidine/putrescine transport system substrate-binding protein
MLTVPAEQTHRQLSAQYPTEEMIERSAVMSYFDTEENARINQMWINVRCYNIENVPVWAWIVTGLIIAGLIVLAVRKHFKKKVYIK